MKYVIALCCLFAVGCSSTNDLSSLKSSLRISGETIVAKQDESLTILKENTTALAAIKSQIDTLKASQVESETLQPSQEVIPSVVPPAERPQDAASDKHPSPIVASSEAVRLFITSSEQAAEPFHCPPCERMKKAIEAGEFSEFDIKYVPEFDGQKSFPATRFASPESPTGWLVVYGYDDTTLDTIKERSGVIKVVSMPSNNTPPVPLSRTVTSSRDDAHFGGSLSQPRDINQVMSHGDKVALHNQLHGGGNWTWLGDLSKHLQTVHGVVTAGGEQPVSGSFFPVHRQSTVTSARPVVRSNTWGQGFFGRSRTVSQ